MFLTMEFHLFDHGIPCFFCHGIPWSKTWNSILVSMEFHSGIPMEFHGGIPMEFHGGIPWFFGGPMDCEGGGEDHR